MPPIRPELLDELLKDYQKPDGLLDQDGLLQQLTKALVERALNGELTHHLGYEKYDSAGDNSGNSRNGTTPKTLRDKHG
jgi:putative transposase